MTMTTQATYMLRGITSDDGQCDHCGRTLSRLFRIVSPDGAEMVVGRTCSKNLTGYNWSVAQAERIERIAGREAAALVRYGRLYADLTDLSAQEGARFGYGGAATEALIGLRDGKITEATAREWMADAEARLAR